jgi:divalent metal cation (Fe/Co/Zn/Cd) transporter
MSFELLWDSCRLPKPEPIGVETVLAEVEDTEDVLHQKFEGNPASLKSPEQLALESSAKLVSWISIIISLIVGGAGIGVGLQGGALAVVGLAGETLLDAVSSTMVLWRYKKGKAREFKDAEEAQRRMEDRDNERERRFTLIIGVAFVVFATLLLISSLVHLTHQWTSEEAEETSATDSLFVAWPAFFIFIVLAVWKFRLAEQLQSKTLRQDAICTVFGAVLALITGIASTCEKLLVTEGDDDKDAFGIVDPLASILIAVLVGGEGMRAIYHNAEYFQDHHQLP